MSETRPDDQRSLLPALRALRASAPPDLSDRVCQRLGLATEVDEFVLVDGPPVSLFVAFGPSGISHVLAADLLDGDPERFQVRHRERFGRPVRPATKPPAGLVAALRTGQGRSLHYDLRGLSDFERAVLGKALEIPPGELRPYAWVAREIGRPAAVRAVGSALGRNPVPVLIPCHRVVRSDGQVGDYAFGAPMKRRLLEAEHVDVAEAQRLARSGARFMGSDTTGVFCFPTCRHARRITAAHRMLFRSAAAAAEARFRPCADCRPGERTG